MTVNIIGCFTTYFCTLLQLCDAVVTVTYLFKYICHTFGAMMLIFRTKLLHFVTSTSMLMTCRFSLIIRKTNAQANR